MTVRSVFLAALALTIAAPAAADTLTVARDADSRSINPGVNRDDNTDAVTLHMVEGLVGYRANGTVAPLLAKSFDVSDDGLTYTFHLRSGVKFHNGAEMTSADVLWSWNRYMDPKTEWRCLSEFDGRNGLKVETVEAPDPQTFVMKVNRKSALFLDSLARTDCAMAGVLHKDSVNPDGSFKTPIGTGPFKFGEWRRGEFLTLTRFDAYTSPQPGEPDGYVGSKRPLVAEVKFQVVPDASVAKAGLLSGAIDISDILDSDVAELSKESKLEVKTTPTAVKHGFLFQTRDPLLKNVKLRQAIATALDIPQLVAGASNNLGQPNASAIHVSSRYYDDVQRETYKYDPAKAQALLKEAGYKGEPIKLIANKRGTMPSFPAALVAQAMLQAVGINVEIEVLEWATQLDRYQKGNYQMMSFSYSTRFDPALSYEQFSGPKDKQSRKIWDNPEVQALLDKASTISDEAERTKIFQELHRRQLEETPLIFIYNGVDACAIAKRVKGYKPWAGSKPLLWEVSVD